MKKALNAWSVPPAVGFAEMFRTLRAAGFDGVELNVDAPDHSAHSLGLETTAQQLAAIRAEADAAGIAIHSISTSLTGPLMGAVDPDSRARFYALAPADRRAQLLGPTPS